MGHNLVNHYAGLLVRKGQVIRRDHHNNLVKLADAITIQRGAVKGRQYPDGWTPRIQVTQSVSVDCPWQGSVGQLGAGQWGFSFSTPGYLGGIIPAINGTPIDQLDKNGNPPQLAFGNSAFAQYGTAMRSLLLLAVAFASSGFVQSVTPIAVPVMPVVAGLASGMAYANIGFFTGSGSSSNVTGVTYRQMRFFNIGFAAPAWFWADS